MSKLGGEHYCQAFYESYGLPTTSRPLQQRLRPGPAPGQPVLRRRLEFLVDAPPGGRSPIHGDGEQTRDYTYVDDAVEATLLAATRPRAEGEVFNVGTGIETSVNRLGIDRPALRHERPRSSTSTAATSTTSAAVS